MWKWVTKIFRRRTPEQRLLQQYDDLMKRAHDASHRDRRASDALRAQAEAIWEEIEILRFFFKSENDNT